MSILQISISAGILILVIAFVRIFAINRLPKMVFITLWGIAATRLIVPFSIPLKSGISDLFYSINGFFPQTSTMSTRAMPGEQDSYTYSLFYQGSITRDPPNMEPMLWIWAIGAAILAIFFTASYYKCSKEIKTALPIRGNAAIDKWLRGQNIKRTLNILVSDRITTPLAYGLLKPRIILPKTLDFSNELQMRYILAHEFVHIKRFDTLWKLVLIVVLCCHWFNPAVWLLFVLMNRDLEIACDEKVIRCFGEKVKSAYALSLINMAEHRASFTPLYSSFSKNATEERIVSIMKFRKTSMISMALALLLIAGAMPVLAVRKIEEVQQLYGEVQADSGSFSFSLGDKGIITVKDSNDNFVSTSAVNSDGEVILTDGSGNVIITIDLDKSKKAMEESKPHTKPVIDTVLPRL